MTYQAYPHVFTKGIQGCKTRSVWVCPNDGVQDLKTRTLQDLEEQTIGLDNDILIPSFKHLPNEKKVNLTFQNKMLEEDGRTPNDYCIQTDSTILMTSRLSGGGKRAKPVASDAEKVERPAMRLTGDTRAVADEEVASFTTAPEERQNLIQQFTQNPNIIQEKIYERSIDELNEALKCLPSSQDLYKYKLAEFLAKLVPTISEIERGCHTANVLGHHRRELEGHRQVLPQLGQEHRVCTYGHQRAQDTRLERHQLQGGRGDQAP